MAKIIRINGYDYAYTEILARRDDAVVLEVDDEAKTEVEVPKVVEQAEMPDSTETAERQARKGKAVPAPTVTVLRSGVDTGGTGLAGSAANALKRGE